MLIDTADNDVKRLYAEHARGLFAFLAYRTGDRSLAEEVLAEAFEKALRARGGFDPRRAAAKTWLYAIALNCLRDRRRRGEAESRALDRLGADSARAPHADEIGRIEERDALARALSTLSAEEREAIALRYGGALTVPEISRLLDEKLTTVEGRVYRALGKLRAELS